MVRCLIVIFCLFLFLHEVKAQNQVHRGNTRAVIGIVVENMRPDYVHRYWNKFGNSGFKKLYTEGAICSDFTLLQHIQNIGTGTATLFTGVSPSEHGIVDLHWYDRQNGKEVNCVADPGYKTVGSDSNTGKVSPLKLLSSTFGDHLKLLTNGKSKVFSVAMNDATALLSAGYSGDAAYWFDTGSGRMITTSYYRNTLPAWMVEYNNKNAASRYATRNWALLKSLNDYSESNEDNHPLEKGYGGGLNHFPHSVGALIKSSGDFAPLKTTPFANTLIREFTLELLENEQIGADEYPDLLTVAFSSMDYENISFGPLSVEMEDLYLRLDQEISEIITLAEKKIGKENLLFFLTANTSASYPPIYLREKLRFPTGVFSPETAVALLNSYLNITFGDMKWIEYHNGLQLYLNHNFVEINKVNLQEIREKIAVFLSQFDGIQQVVTADQVEQKQPLNTPLEGLYKSYQPGRSGDVLYLLREGWQIEYKFKRVNYTDETHVPLVFYGAGISPSIRKKSYEATSLVPTLCEILKIPRPGKCRGSIIEGF